MDQIIKVAWELNENAENRYKLVYEIAELAKKLVDETQMKKARDEFGFEEGEKAGLAKGYEHAALETARRMLALKKFSLEEISAISGLSSSELQKLQKNY